MNALSRSLIEKAGYDNGFEIVQKSESSIVSLCSSLHPVNANISEGGHEGAYIQQFTGNLSLTELKRGLNKELFLNDKIEVWNSTNSIDFIRFNIHGEIHPENTHGNILKSVTFTKVKQSILGQDFNNYILKGQSNDTDKTNFKK